MRHTMLLVLTAVNSLLAGTEALRLVERGATPAVVGLDTQRRSIDNPAFRDRSRLRRRQDGQTATVIVDNEDTLYFVNASLGTPPQNLRFHLDTGSSDLWTNSASSRYCASSLEPCQESGTYSANDSSTYKYLSSDFRILYVDESGARGDYATETLHIGGVDVPDLQFGIGYSSSSGESILGIGYSSNEAQVVRGIREAYKNLPELMVENKMIKSNAYSLWLNDLDASTGSILFGGVNTEKYVGQLQTLPMQTAYDEDTPSQFFITLTEISFAQDGQSGQVVADKLAVPVLLDSGSSLTYLPNDIAYSIIASVKAEYRARSEVALVPCSQRNSGAKLNFKFTSPVISVPMDELVIPLDSSSAPVTMSDGKTPACLFGISPAGENSNVLGDTFLRSAYVVYDLANAEISIAQTNFNSTKDRVVEITTGKEAVPDANAVANPVTAVASTTGARIGRPTATLTGASGTVTASPASPTKKGGAVVTAGEIPSLQFLWGLVGVGLVFVGLF
ncbi:MAG: hypothetical protein M1816_000277 [Peltula sp. TS41687]|nr:MAG: hypothetical protein M1816_000277 [Peltula sp. TS41687]